MDGFGVCFLPTGFSGFVTTKAISKYSANLLKAGTAKIDEPPKKITFFIPRILTSDAKRLPCSELSSTTGALGVLTHKDYLIIQ
jgi:hypothetical protein